jgi:hypothetical protein
MTRARGAGLAESPAQAAAAVEARVKRHVRVIRSSWVKLAEDLDSFVGSEMWRDLGQPSLEAWLAQPEIELSRRQVYYLRQAWRELVVKRDVTPAQLEQVDMSKVQEVLPAIKRGLVDVDEALSDCRALERSKLRLRYRTSRSTTTAATPDEAPAVAGLVDGPEWAMCEACGSRYRVPAREADDLSDLEELPATNLLDDAVEPSTCSCERPIVGRDDDGPRCWRCGRAPRDDRGAEPPAADSIRRLQERLE